jgi:uncharacterized protein with HEPN domain
MPEKPTRTIEHRLADIKAAIDILEDRLAGGKAKDFAKDRWSQLATQKALEIISEASRHIPDELKARHLEIP